MGCPLYSVVCAVSSPYDARGFQPVLRFHSAWIQVLSVHSQPFFLRFMLSWLKLHVWNDTQPAPEFAAAQTGADHQALAYLVPRKFESLEVWLLMFCGVFGLLVSALVLRGARDIMLACVVMLCLAGWRRFHPARNQTQWLLGAALALLLAGWIFIDPRSGGSSGPYIYLLLFIAICYPLVMNTLALLGFTLALVGLYIVTGWSSKGALSTELFVLGGLMLAGMCLLSGRFGQVLRKAEQGIDRLRRDKASLAYNEHGLERYGARLLHTCAAENQPCTLVLLPLHANWHAPIDARGRGSDYSAAHAYKMQSKALREMALHLTLALPNDAIVSRNAQGDWVVLVPWLDRQAVLNKLELAFGRPVQLPFGPRHEELFVAISPCAVVSNGVQDTLERMVARAQDIWLRGVRTGAVDSQH
jgi:hypothetical protein